MGGELDQHTVGLAVRVATARPADLDDVTLRSPEGGLGVAAVLPIRIAVEFVEYRDQALDRGLDVRA